MNEEEKQAVEILQGLCTDNCINNDVVQTVVNLIEKQQKEIRKLQINIEIIINEIVNKANRYDYLNKITAGINKPEETAYLVLKDLLEEINKKLGE